MFRTFLFDYRRGISLSDSTVSVLTNEQDISSQNTRQSFATVATGTVRDRTEFIHVEFAAIAHQNLFLCQTASFVRSSKTHVRRDAPLSDMGQAAPEPSGIAGVAVITCSARGQHLHSRASCKPVPALGQLPVARAHQLAVISVTVSFR